MTATLERATGTIYNKTLPAGWRLVAASVRHPDYRGVAGDLCCCDVTGVYRLIRYGALVGVPHGWARALDVEQAPVAQR